MGSSTSGILAILFMDKLEQIALSSHRFISPYKRYVDDIYLQTANEEKANEFYDTMNGLNPRKSCSSYITSLPYQSVQRPISSATNGGAYNRDVQRK